MVLKAGFRIGGRSYVRLADQDQLLWRKIRGRGKGAESAPWPGDATEKIARFAVLNQFSGSDLRKRCRAEPAVFGTNIRQIRVELRMSR